MADGYTLVTERWKERKMTPELLRQLVGRMDDEYGAIGSGLFGSALLNDQGEQIGIWYSVIDITIVEMLSGTEVRVTPPPVMKLDERRSGGRE